MTKTTTRQTVRINGKRTIVTTRNGRVTQEPALPLEWELQAAAVRALRSHPDYGKRFLFVGGMEAGRRGHMEATKAKATGLTAGHPDLTVFLEGGRCSFIEYKTKAGRLSPEQKARHEALREIGHDVEVVKSESQDECAEATINLVCGWLDANGDYREAA